MAQATTGTLSAHSGSVPILRAELATLPAPRQIGPYHCPVAHFELLDLLEGRLKTKLNASIRSESYSIRRGGSTLFGVMNLEWGEHDDFAAAIGLRHANDMSLSMQFVCGLNVFVCDNMALRGDSIFLRKRHTINLDLRTEIDAGIEVFSAQYGVFSSQINALKTKQLTDGAAALQMLSFIYDKQVMPAKYLPEVRREYFEPRHDEFKPRTEWSLHNAFTEVAKQMPMTPRMDAIQQLGVEFGLVA
jgi:hypothetical protein